MEEVLLPVSFPTSDLRAIKLRVILRRGLSICSPPVIGVLNIPPSGYWRRRCDTLEDRRTEGKAGRTGFNWRHALEIVARTYTSLCRMPRAIPLHGVPPWRHLPADKPLTWSVGTLPIPTPTEGTILHSEDLFSSENKYQPWTGEKSSPFPRYCIEEVVIIFNGKLVC